MKNLTFRQWLGIVKITVGVLAFNAPFAAPLLARLFAGGWPGAPNWIFFALLLGGFASIVAGIIDYLGWSVLLQRIREEANWDGGDRRR